MLEKYRTELSLETASLHVPCQGPWTFLHLLHFSDLRKFPIYSKLLKIHLQNIFNAYDKTGGHSIYLETLLSH